MASRPVVSVYTSADPTKIAGNVAMPGVFQAQIRNDIVEFVHTGLNKNRRQGRGVSRIAGQQHSAESWGPGRAVARVPRVSGSGTGRSSQGAFANSCRGGHMYQPLRIWRKFHQKVNLKQKRHACASAVAASGVAPLVMARGHQVDEIPELPLVVDSLNVEKTKNLLELLRKLGATADLERVRTSRKIRTGRGKMRNRRYVLRKGPLIVYGNANGNVKKAARNISGVEVCHVSRLNLLQLAPGGHLGRFVIWTKDAFAELDTIFGTLAKRGVEKKNYQLQRPLMKCADLARIINSDNIQKILRDTRANVRQHEKTRKNPLKNRTLMKRLNPYDAVRRTAQVKAEAEAAKKRAATRKALRKDKANQQQRKDGRSWFAKIQEDLETAYKKDESEEEEEADDE